MIEAGVAALVNNNVRWGVVGLAGVSLRLGVLGSGLIGSISYAVVRVEHFLHRMDVLGGVNWGARGSVLINSGSACIAVMTGIICRFVVEFHFHTGMSVMGLVTFFYHNFFSGAF